VHHLDAKVGGTFKMSFRNFTTEAKDRIQGDFVRIVIFGAAGATGRALVTHALPQGHEDMAFVRSPAKFDLKHASLNVVQGDVADAAAVERALFGQDAVPVL
jgi:nucleoside-diphosphate-sugar epimerase